MSQGFVNPQTITLPVPVSDGGSGRATATAYGVICGGTTSTGAHQSIASVGTSGQVLTSNGAGALPTFQTLQQGNVVAWANFDGTGTIAIRASGNVTSLTDNGSGDYTVNFTNSIVDANYAVNVTSNYQETESGSLWYGLSAHRSLATGSVRVVTGPENTSFATWLGKDNPTVCVTVVR